MEENPEILCFEISQEHPTLPKSEVLSLTRGELLDEFPGVLIVKVPEVDEGLKKLGMCYRVSKVLHFGDLSEILEFAEKLKLKGSFRVRAVKKRDDISGLEIEKEIGARIMKEGLRVDLKNPDFEVRVILGERCYLALKLFECERKEVMRRKPHRMPFFHPGVMLPQFARAIVNISQVKKGEIFLDPFCGTGGILYEAECIGARAFGVDISPKILFGARKNVSSELILGDAKKLPLKDSSVDAIATDLPYGRSTSLSDPYEELYPLAIEEIHRVLKPSRRAIIVTDRDIRDHLTSLFNVEELHKQRVHGTLTRYFWVLRK